MSYRVQNQHKYVLSYNQGFLCHHGVFSSIHVNAIAPGYMETVLTSDMRQKNPSQYQEITCRIPAHRWGKPEDLQGAVLFLSSNASNYVTGAILPVDGGYLGK